MSADPKEKELYSIKPLEWRHQGKTEDYNECFLFNPIFMPSYRVYEKCWWWLGDDKTTPCNGFEDGKRQAQDHFNSKLKLCLNREL